uniref:Uncharacterized protein n=1 Tax=Lutzomyia longipalpis TaxID=7200 RepID=A0A1B0GIG8_LUTLO
MGYAIKIANKRNEKRLSAIAELTALATVDEKPPKIDTGQRDKDRDRDNRDRERDWQYQNHHINNNHSNHQQGNLVVNHLSHCDSEGDDDKLSFSCNFEATARAVEIEYLYIFLSVYTGSILLIDVAYGCSYQILALSTHIIDRVAVTYDK